MNPGHDLGMTTTDRPGLLAPLGRARVMGVLNVTPDSFSDGGQHLDRDEAIRFGRQLAADGADLVDVGGESTRPGAPRVAAAEELRRVVPVVAALCADGITVSIDTTRPEVAEAALDAGAGMVNDTSGGADPRLLAVVAARGVPYVLMHSRGPSVDMAARAQYADVVAEVRAELAGRLALAVAAGVDEAQVVLDPGIGFAKSAEQNWPLLAHLDAIASLGRPVLVGTSRKSFLGSLLAGPDGRPRPVDDREAATQATTALAAWDGAWGVRVHDVRAAADAVRVVAAVRAAREVSG